MKGHFGFCPRRLSLRLKLTFIFFAVALGAWLVAGLLSWWESREQLDEFFDSYQLLLAQHLAAVDWVAFEAPGGVEAPAWPDEDLPGEADDDALAFFVFGSDGRLIFSDGRRPSFFPFKASAQGFGEIFLDGEKWRLLWLSSADGRTRVAVGQELEYRREAALELAAELFWPWLLGFLLFVLISIWFLSRELKPLRSIAAQLHRRRPDDLSPLVVSGLPAEVEPLAQSLNDVLARLEKLLKRERAFVSDAAHELRSPLTALKVQAEVAQLAQDEPQVRAEALMKLLLGIDRTTRLVEQLLALSRLDRGAAEAHSALDWEALIKGAIEETRSVNDDIEISFHVRRPFSLSQGRPLLLALMLRNLLDNARRYSPPGAKIVEIVLDGPRLWIVNSGVKVAPELLPRLGERFFRPPGQSQSGSGLGLAIAAEVAELHGLKLSFSNVEKGFKVELSAL